MTNPSNYEELIRQNLICKARATESWQNWFDTLLIMSEEHKVKTKCSFEVLALQLPAVRSVSDPFYQTFGSFGLVTLLSE